MTPDDAWQISPSFDEQLLYFWYPSVGSLDMPTLTSEIQEILIWSTDSAYISSNMSMMFNNSPWLWRSNLA